MSGELAWVGGTPIEVSTDGKWHYWVAYTFGAEIPGVPDYAGTGAMAINITPPLTNGAAVSAVKAHITATLDLRGVVVQSWQLLKVPADSLPPGARRMASTGRDAGVKQ